MKTNIALSKKFEIKGQTVPYYYNDTFITNGKFMIKKSFVKDYHKYCIALFSHDVNRNKDICTSIDKVAQNATKEGSFMLIKTDRLYDEGFTYTRVFIDSNGKEYLFDETYIKHFEIDSLETHGENEIAFDSEGAFFLMPMRINREQVEKLKHIA